MHRSIAEVFELFQVDLEALLVLADRLELGPMLLDDL
jgi:hypothetical protein